MGFWSLIPVSLGERGYILDLFKSMYLKLLFPGQSHNLESKATIRSKRPISTSFFHAEASPKTSNFISSIFVTTKRLKCNLTKRTQ